MSNKVLIENGAGILAIPVESKRKFETLLIDYYETEDFAPLKEFLVEMALDGYETSSAHKQPSISPKQDIAMGIDSARAQALGSERTRGKTL